MLGIFSVLIKHQPWILLFWTLFDTCPYCYRHISLYISSFVPLIFWKNDIVFRPSLWKKNILFTNDCLEKSRKWKLGVHYEPWLEFLEKFSANNFALPDAGDNTSGPLNRGGIADLPLLRTLLAIYGKAREPSFWEMMDSVLVAYASLAASRTLLQQLLTCLNFTLDSERFILLVQTKSDLSSRTAAQTAENHWDEWGFTWYLRWRIYTSISTWTYSQHSLAAADALSLKISSHGTSLKWPQRKSIQHKNSHSRK